MPPNFPQCGSVSALLRCGKHDSVMDFTFDHTHYWKKWRSWLKTRSRNASGRRRSEISPEYRPFGTRAFPRELHLGFPLGRAALQRGLIHRNRRPNSGVGICIARRAPRCARPGGSQASSPNLGCENAALFHHVQRRVTSLAKGAWCGRRDSNSHGCYPTATSTLRVSNSATTARDQVVRGRIALGAVNVKGQKPWQVQFST